ncbi:MAG: hypothetical protein J6Y43_00565 [Clostridia bacterium]|nr:hypothetical protein [Clostridia bacterium]
MKDKKNKILQKIYQKQYTSYKDYFKTVKRYFGAAHCISKEGIERFEYYAKVDANEFFLNIYNLLKKYKVEPLHMDMILTESATWFYLSHYPNLECAIKRFMLPDGTVDGAEIYFESMY